LASHRLRRAGLSDPRRIGRFKNPGWFSNRRGVRVSCYMEPSATDPVKLVAAGSPTDGELAGRTLNGDRTAFDELVRRYQRQAVAVSYRLLGNSHDALEVTQDAFLKAYNSLSTLQKPEAFGGWLMRIVSNLSLNFRRSRRTRRQLPLDDLLGAADSQPQGAGGSEWRAASADPVRKLEGQELGQKLQEAMNQLPEKQRLAIVMFTIEQMPQKQVAETLGCSVEAVKWHVFQGRKKLKELLKDVM
jgi:RNA polymerase sigma-70 factor (ECF subfamily)